MAKAPAFGGVITFSIPVPASSKNSRQLVRTRGKRLRSLPSREAKDSKLFVETAALQALRELGFDVSSSQRAPLFGDDDIAMSIHHCANTDRVHVRVWSAHARSSSSTSRKRDLQNLPEAICDALQGILFKNDNQIVQLSLFRHDHRD